MEEKAYSGKGRHAGSSPGSSQAEAHKQRCRQQRHSSHSISSSNNGIAARQHKYKAPHTQHTHTNTHIFKVEMLHVTVPVLHRVLAAEGRSAGRGWGVKAGRGTRWARAGTPSGRAVGGIRQAGTHR